MEKVTRHVGFCAICECDFKLTPEMKLVHHAYKRPGDGYIHGGCRAVHKDPYEVSCEPLKEYRGLLRQGLEHEKKLLARLKAGEHTHFEKTGHVGFAGRLPETTSYSRYVTDPYVFDHEVESKVHSTEHRIAGILREIERMEKHIAAWTPKPVRTVEEVAAEKAKRSAEHKAARETAKKEKADKRAEINAKRKTRGEAKKATLEEILSTARDLAARKEKGEDVAAGTKKLHALIRQNHNTLWILDLKPIYGDLVALGLATWTYDRTSIRRSVWK